MLVGHGRVHLLGVLHDVRPGRLRVVPGRPDRGADRVRQPGQGLSAQRAPGDDRAERDRQPGGPLPVLAHVGELVQPVVLVREARLVDDQSGIDLPVAHRRHDLVEGHDHDLADPAGHGVRRPQAEEEIGGRRLAGHRDRPAAQIRAGLPRQHERAAAPAQRAAAGQQGVVVEDVRQYGVRHLQHVRLAALGHAVGDVDVRERHVEGGGARDAAVGEGVEDEGVVGAGGVRDPQGPGGLGSPGARAGRVSGPGRVGGVSRAGGVGGVGSVGGVSRVRHVGSNS